MWEEVPERPVEPRTAAECNDNHESGVHPGNVTLLISGTLHIYHILTIGEGGVGSRKTIAKTLATIDNNDNDMQM